MEDIEETNTPLTKPKKPRSEKQIEAFKIAMQKRAESIAKKKDEQIYQSAKLLIEKQQKEELVEDSESEPEPEPLRYATAKTSEPIKKSKSKKQIEVKPKSKPKKKIIIESESETDTSESESESSESSDSEPEFIIKSRSKKKTKPKKISEQNTRVKRSEPVHNHPAKSNTDYNVYFV